MIKDLKLYMNDRIINANKVIIIPHNNPDFDAIGSAAGITLIAKKFKKDPVKAPIYINPACPRLSSPSTPTTRLRDTAIIDHTQIGISIPETLFERLPAFDIPFKRKYVAIIATIVMIVVSVDFLIVNFFILHLLHFLFNLLTEKSCWLKDKNDYKNKKYNRIS
mgnify:CR=1 FL=1